MGVRQITVLINHIDDGYFNKSNGPRWNSLVLPNLYNISVSDVITLMLTWIFLNGIRQTTLNFKGIFLDFFAMGQWRINRKNNAPISKLMGHYGQTIELVENWSCLTLLILLFSLTINHLLWNKIYQREIHRFWRTVTSSEWGSLQIQCILLPGIN